MTTRKNAGNTRGKPFQPGNSGRPKGARNRATVAAESLLDGEAEALTRKAVELALQGDMTALRLCLDRIIPPRKSRTVSVPLPDLDKPADIKIALNALVRSVANGDLTPHEAQSVSALLETSRRTQELIDIEQRLKRLENKQS